MQVVRLTQIYRQARESLIVVNAHRINQGEFPVLPTKLGRGDFAFIESDEPEDLKRRLLDLVGRDLPQKYGLDPMRDLQVITPMHRGPVGIQNLNHELQQRLNPESPAWQWGGRAFRRRDKVMQLRNNYYKEVFNGDIGQVCGHVAATGQLQVDFDGRVVTYEPAEKDEITLAYAVTVHKAQGSEFPGVLIVLTTHHYMLLQRNLLYTALTRAAAWWCSWGASGPWAWPSTTTGRSGAIPTWRPNYARRCRPEAAGQAPRPSSQLVSVLFAPQSQEIDFGIGKRIKRRRRHGLAAVLTDGLLHGGPVQIRSQAGSRILGDFPQDAQISYFSPMESVEELTIIGTEIPGIKKIVMMLADFRDLFSEDVDVSIIIPFIVHGVQNLGRQGGDEGDEVDVFLLRQGHQGDKLRPSVGSDGLVRFKDIGPFL